MAKLEILLLGPFQVRLNGMTVTAFESVKVRALLAYLTAEYTRAHTRESLATLLWPDWPQQSSMRNLRNTLADLRKNIGDREAQPPFLLVTRESIQLNGEADVKVDVAEFESAILNPQSTIEASGLLAHNLQSTISLYRGPFLDGFSLPDSLSFEEWLLAKREYFSQQMLKTFSRLTEWSLEQREYEQAEGYARRQIELEPWREQAYQQLMRALSLKGERVQALRQFQTLREALQSELEVQPSPATLQLYEAIQSGQISSPVETPAPSGPPYAQDVPTIERRPRHNLPQRLSTFIGREKEIDQVIAFLHDTRLLTVTGAGGVGKTSLALQAVRNMLEAFPDGAWLVELAPLANPELVPQACAQSLELIKPPDTPYLPALIHYLQKKNLLLILDNVEHLIEVCSHLVAELLKSCPKLTILATSRELLNLPGERAFRLPSMAVPDPRRVVSLEQIAQYESVRLFVERARQISPDFSLTQENAAEIVLICQRLDGIPLAIELAAARVRVIAVEQIAARLNHTFHLLAGGSREALPRHQTLKATIDWSYDLLSPKERLLLQRLSVFAGGWTLEAAEAVVSDGENTTNDLAILPDEVLDFLTLLVDKSLVQVEGRESRDRYTMLEVIRQYARAKLVESGGDQTVRSRHLAYYARMTSQAEPYLRGKDMLVWLTRLDDELDNLRLALEWSLTSDVERGLQIMADLMWFWWIRNLFDESSGGLEKLLAAEAAERGEGSLENGRALQRARGLRAFNYLSPSKRPAVMEESIAILRRLGPVGRREMGLSLYDLWIHYPNMQLPPPDDTEMLEIFHQYNDRFYYSEYLLEKGIFAYLYRVEMDEAEALLQQSLAISREIGDIDGIGGRVFFLGVIAGYAGNYSSAESLFLEAMEAFRKVGNRPWEANVYGNLVWLAHVQGNYAEALRLNEVYQKRGQELDDRGAQFIALNNRARIAWEMGDYPLAKSLAEEQIERYPEFQSTLGIAYYQRGLLTLSEGGYIQAESLWKQNDALQLMKTEDSISKNISLLAWVVLFSKQGRLPQAARVLGAVEKIYRRTYPGLSPRVRNEHDHAMETVHSALGAEAFAAAFAEGQAMTLDQACEYVVDVLG